MSRQPYHTSPALNEQLRTLNEEGWEQAVLSQLPADYEAQASQLGAFERERELQRPAQILRAVLAYVLGGMSFRKLACWAVLIGLASPLGHRLAQAHQALPGLAVLDGARTAHSQPAHSSRGCHQRRDPQHQVGGCDAPQRTRRQR